MEISVDKKFRKQANRIFFCLRAEIDELKNKSVNSVEDFIRAQSREILSKSALEEAFRKVFPLIRQSVPLFYPFPQNPLK